MWLQAEINQNPDALVGIVSEEDVKKIASTIQKENDEYICSRIAYELTLDGVPACLQNPKEPVLVQALEVLDETFIKNKADDPVKTKLEQLQKRIEDIFDITKDEKICDLLLNTNELSPENLNNFKQLLSFTHDATHALLYDGNARRKKHYKSWGSFGGYRAFLYNCALLYCELTGDDFNSDFYRDKEKKICAPITDATRFLYEFHIILNKIAELYSCKTFEDKSFASACSEIRNELNKAKKPTKQKH